MRQENLARVHLSELNDAKVLVYIKVISTYSK